MSEKRKPYSYIGHDADARTNSLPERPQINEHITVLGFGIAGGVAAWLLDEVGYKVTILEQNQQAFSGASKDALGLHLGGRYAMDFSTAQECLESGLLFKRLMPFALQENSQGIRFLIGEKSTVDYLAYIQFYNRQRDLYAKLSPEGIFGPPETFYRELTPGLELIHFKNIVGGVATQEPIYDMQGAKNTLLNTLNARGVEIRTGAQVQGIKKIIMIMKLYGKM